MEHFKSNPFTEILTDKELDSVVDSYSSLYNPLYFLFGKEDREFTSEYRKEIITITNESIAKIKAHDKQFLLSLKNRLLDSKSYDGPESSLGEIRTYGILYDLFGDNVKPRQPSPNKPTSDFEVSLKDKKIIVEVNSPQPDVTLNNEGKLKWEKELFKEALDLPNGKTFSIRVTSKAPFGRENCQNLYENVIHKLTQIKQGDKQSEQDYYSILWVDLFDANISIISETGIFKKPLLVKEIEGDTIVSTNVLWYSIYGKKGLPIYDSKTAYDGTTAIMLHDGKFVYSSSSKWDMVIFASPLNTVVYQNPYSSKQPSIKLIKKIRNLARFNRKMSRISVSKEHLKNIIRKDYKFIQKINDKNKTQHF